MASRSVYLRFVLKLILSSPCPVRNMCKSAWAQKPLSVVKSMEFSRSKSKHHHSWRRWRPWRLSMISFASAVPLVCIFITTHESPKMLVHASQLHTTINVHHAAFAFSSSTAWATPRP